MSHIENDEDLRAAFGALRRETAAGLARFQAPRMVPARRAIRWHLRPLLVTGLIAAAVAGFVLERRAVERREMMAPFLSSTTWEAPTDFLLATPGQDILSTPALSVSVVDSISGTP